MLIISLKYVTAFSCVITLGFSADLSNFWVYSRRCAYLPSVRTVDEVQWGLLVLFSSMISQK